MLKSAYVAGVVLAAGAVAAQEDGRVVNPPPIPQGFATPGEDALGARLDAAGSLRDLDSGASEQRSTGPADEGVATRAGFVTAMARAGCAMGAQEAAGNLAAEGFPQKFVQEMSTQMVFDGEARYEGGHALRLLPAICPPAAGQAAMTPREVLLEVFSAHGCTLSDQAARETFPERGFTESQLRGIVRPMIETGDATIADRRLTIAAPLCGGQG